MIVCICHRVSDRDIARAAHNGCASFDDLQFELSVATSCGKCHDCAHETFHRHAAQQPTACAQPWPGNGAAMSGKVIQIAIQHLHDTGASRPA